MTKTRSVIYYIKIKNSRFTKGEPGYSVSALCESAVFRDKGLTAVGKSSEPPHLMSQPDPMEPLLLSQLAVHMEVDQEEHRGYHPG